MPTTSRMAAPALATVISPIITLVRLCSHGRSRSMRPGSPMMSATRSTTQDDQKDPGGVAVAQLRGQCRPEQARRDDGQGHRPAGFAGVGPLGHVGLLLHRHAAIFPQLGLGAVEPGALPAESRGC